MTPEKHTTYWIQQEKWEFFRCGGRHVLFEPIGKFSSTQGLLLRVRRKEARKFTTLDVAEDQHFVREFFGTILGSCYLPETEVIPVSTEFLSQLSLLLHRSRCQAFPHQLNIPLQETDVDIYSKSVLLVRDQRKLSLSTSVSSEDCVCIEWKPKYMLLPRSRLIPPPLSKYKYRYYRCNLKKFQYDPEDIFSFQPDKVRRALSSLIQQKSKFLQLLYPKQQDSVSSTVLETKLDIIVHILCKEAALLTRLRMIQQLDILDYQGAKLALEALGVSTQHDLEKLEKKIFGKSFSPTWLKEELLHLNNHDDMIFHSEEEKLRMEWCLAEDTRELEESFQRGRSYLRSLDSVELARILGDFLYSTITKDCSLLITFVPVSDYSGLPCIWKTLCIGQQMYYYCISVVDLEPKSLKKLNKWLESDRYLFQCP